MEEEQNPEQEEDIPN